MEKLTVTAPAKLNLTLDVLDRRPDGYHNLRMVMQTVSLRDEIVIRQRGKAPLSMSTNLPYLPGADRNIAAIAARALSRAAGRSLDGLSIRVTKRIPVCAGCGGGSADGAAVLRGLNQLWETGLSREELAVLGAEVGSDVPFCVLGGTALALGRGEQVTPLKPLPPCWFVLCKPPFYSSTPELFRWISGRKIRCRPDTDGLLAALEEGSLPRVARRMFNVFEEVLPMPRRRELEEIRGILLRYKALGACMTGTGPTMFGLFAQEEDARAAQEELSARYQETFCARPLEREQIS